MNDVWELQQRTIYIYCSWGFGALLKDLTSVVVSKVERTLVIQSPPRQFLPDLRFEPTRSVYKSDTLSIRPWLPPIFITRSVHNLWCFCHLWSLALFLKKKECQMGFSDIAREAQNKRVYEENYVVELEI